MHTLLSLANTASNSSNRRNSCLKVRTTAPPSITILQPTRIRLPQSLMAKETISAPTNSQNRLTSIQLRLISILTKL